MFRWLIGQYYARLRRLDIEILWPTLKDQAADLDHARLAFIVHAMGDPAWTFLPYDDMIQIIYHLS